jgi:hypothetical protein
MAGSRHASIAAIAGSRHASIATIKGFAKSDLMCKWQKGNMFD